MVNGILPLKASPRSRGYNDLANDISIEQIPEQIANIAGSDIDGLEFSQIVSLAVSEALAYASNGRGKKTPGITDAALQAIITKVALAYVGEPGPSAVDAEHRKRHSKTEDAAGEADDHDDEREPEDHHVHKKGKEFLEALLLLLKKLMKDRNNSEEAMMMYETFQRALMRFSHNMPAFEASVAGELAVCKGTCVQLGDNRTVEFKPGDITRIIDANKDDPEFKKILASRNPERITAAILAAAPQEKEKGTLELASQTIVQTAKDFTASVAKVFDSIYKGVVPETTSPQPQRGLTPTLLKNIAPVIEPKPSGKTLLPADRQDIPMV